jgi:hypothetical protein
MSNIDDRLDRLESLVEQQQETIERQRERIAELEGDDSGEAEDDTETVPTVSRRGALTAGGLLALLVGGVGTASADSQGQVGTNSDPLTALYTDELNGAITDESGNTDQAVTSLVGNGLTVESEALTVDLGQIPGTETDTASTFSESELSLGTTRTRVSNDTLEIVPGVVSRPADDSSVDNTFDKAGLRFKPNVDLSQITLTVSQQTSNVTTVYVTDTSGTVLDSDSTSGAGDSVTLTPSLTAGTEYYAAGDNGGSSYTRGRATSTDSLLPITSDVIDITGGIYVPDTELTSTLPVISKLEAPPATGTATVEWPEPTSVNQWDTAAFNTAPDGETVEVYVETSDDSGSTWSDWATNPIGSGTDLSAIPSADRVRFRVELSRDNVANDPRLTMISRQWRP